MKIEFKIKCPGCQSFENLKTKKPGFMSPVNHSFICSVCDSRVFVELTKSKNAGKVDTKMRLLPSDKMLAIWKEEAEMASLNSEAE